MSELKNIQDGYNNNRKQLATANASLQKAKAELDKLNAQEKEDLKGLNAQEREEKVKANEEKRKLLVKDIATFTDSKKTLKENFKSLAEGFLMQLDPVEKITELNDNIPVLMFPLRLETRFKSTGNQQQLWLRVYPDDCNINSKEDILSESELKNAKAFWIEMWKAGGTEAEEKAAWRSLVNSHGTGRSAWIIQEYKPTNVKTLKPAEGYKLLVVTTQPVLTSDEKTAAAKYWATVWLAKNDALKTAAANDELIAATSPATAISIQENYIPVNLADDVPADQDINKILISEIVLPAYTPKQGSWTQAAKTMALPDKFVVTTFDGLTKRTILFKKPVKDSLAVSVDPSLSGDDQVKKDADHELVLNEELSWMVDFEKAENAGMATRIDLTPREAELGFERLFVTGIRFTSSETDGKEQLEKLFTDHFYSKSGFELLKQGTPSNNTEDMPAGHSLSDNGDESFDALFKDKENFSSEDGPDKKSDGEKLADCLGIDPAILKIVNNANGKDQLEAYAMNTALFPATLGYFMDEMMDPLFTDRDIDATKAFFSGFVSGRGPLPAIRIGKQPYGILPVSVYSKLNFFEKGQNDPLTTNTKTPFLARLHALLMKMDTNWDSLLPGVAYVGKTGDAHQILLDVVGLHANSIEFHQRYAQTVNQLYNQMTLQYGPFWGALVASFIQQRGQVILNALGINIRDGKLPVLEKYFLSKPNLLSGAFIDDVPDSETEPVRPYSADGLNYIEWLVATTPDKIRTEDFGGNPSPTALLYLLLRHSLTQAQSGAGAKVLVSNNVIASKKVYSDPDFIHVEKNGTGKSKFEHLYNAYPSITNDASLNLVDYLHKTNVLRNFAETKHLRETIDALKILEKTPTARLERLLAEHLDCCSYRIDAWKTGLVQYKLTEQRLKNSANNIPEKGIYLGAYGWLLDVKPQHKILTNETLSPELNAIFNKGNNTALQSDSTNLGYIHAPSLNQAGAAAILRNAYDSNKNTGSGNPFAINLTSDRVRIAANFLEGMRNGQSLAALLGYQFERGLHDKYSLGQGEVDKFIYPLRKAFPLVADNLKDTKSKPEESQETIAASNVLDGLKFINYVKNSPVKTYPFGLPATANLPAANAAQLKAIQDELDRIIDINDAISDLVMAEQVYQVVQGNFERASGNAEAYSKGNYPPDIDIINTPRSGVTLTHRMAVQFEADAVALPGTIARAKAEPAVNKWLAENLPAPEKVLCNIVYSSPVQAETPFTVSQKQLGLEPIDLLYVFSTDTEQAMTELDDRILNYVRYTISGHPKTTIKINYTTPVNTVDKTNVSFFELSALIKSLRKILVGAKCISPAQVLLAKETTPQPSVQDDAGLKTVVQALMNDDLAPVKAGVDTIAAGVHSIAGIAAKLTADIGSAITDASTIGSIITQLKADLKAYLVNPVLDNKNALLTAFENSISSIAVPATINTLKLKYEQYLLQYEADFINLDDLVKNTSDIFLTAAMFDNVQTGTGFMHSNIEGIYNSIFLKIDAVVERWDSKIFEFDLIMTGFAAAVTDDDKIEVLRKAEMIISSTSTYPVISLADYQAKFNIKKAAFDTLFADIKALKTNNQTKVTAFIADTTTVLERLATCDIIAFDTDTATNNCQAEKLQLTLLKEDVVTALNNLSQYLGKKITDCTAAITEADATIDNAEKITALLNGAKKILGDEALILPRFVLNGTAATEFENAVTDSDKLLVFAKTKDARLFPVEDWVGGVARVREKVHHWENITFLTNAFKPAAAIELTPTQFPYQLEDRWLAMKFRDEKDPAEKNPEGKFIFTINNDKLLYTAHFANGFDKTKPQCGIVIDEWTEVIPANEETTGVAFHYDQPNSEPPQTMLLVTPPQITGSWQWNDIIEAMEETLQMAKKRAVEPSQIENTSYAQFLPATMTAVTMHWITAALNLSVNNNIYKIINNGS